MNKIISFFLMDKVLYSPTDNESVRVGNKMEANISRYKEHKYPLSLPGKSIYTCKLQLKTTYLSG